MSLSRQDHKKIALGIASELKRVLGASNGDRLLAKHKARTAPPPMKHPDDPDTEAMLEGMAGEQETPQEDDGEVFEKAIPRLRKKVPPLKK